MIGMLLVNLEAIRDCTEQNFDKYSHVVEVSDPVGLRWPAFGDLSVAAISRIRISATFL
jgi:hypothetical protein